MESHETYDKAEYFISHPDLNLREKITNIETISMMKKQASQKVVFKSKSFSNLNNNNCDTITSIINIVDKDDKLIKEYSNKIN